MTFFCTLDKFQLILILLLLMENDVFCRQAGSFKLSFYLLSVGFYLLGEVDFMCDNTSFSLVA
jgi:hypothetical protein